MNGTSIILQNVTRQDLTSIIQEIIQAEIQKAIPEANPLPDSEHYTRKEVKELYRISYPTLHKLMKEGTLPAYRLGGRVLFKKSDVEGLLEEVETLKYQRQ